MKKFVAIVIALVMVLSMTSAFALNDCTTPTFAWGCPAAAPTYCGKGAIEVVPYVKVNTACGWEYQESDCASLIRSEDVYFAIKLTVDAYPNKLWWENAELELDTEGLIPAFDEAVVFDLFENLIAFTGKTSEKTQVYYFSQGKGWLDASATDFTINKAMWTAQAEAEALACGAAPEYKVCATLSSEHDGKSVWTYGDYTVDAQWAPAQITFLHKNGGSLVVATDANGKINKIDASSDAFFAQVVADFNLNGCAVGTCVNDENIKANFGWDDEQTDCFDWSTKGASVVNPECVVEIPKTGDVSVVAYAVMAIVAAAGMLKK